MSFWDRQGPSAAVPAPAAPGRAADGCSLEKRRSRAWPARHKSVGGPSADSPAPAATPTREAQPGAAAVHAGQLPAATCGERALDASATASAGSPEAHAATNEADGKLRLPTELDQPCRAAAAPPADAGSPARGAAPAARCLSRAGRGGYEQARLAEPARRGRGRRGPCHRSSQSSRPREATPILAPFRRRRHRASTTSRRTPAAVVEVPPQRSLPRFNGRRARGELGRARRRPHRRSVEPSDLQRVRVNEPCGTNLRIPPRRSMNLHFWNPSLIRVAKKLVAGLRSNLRMSALCKARDASSVARSEMPHRDCGWRGCVLPTH
jgi:hypothetical protein